MLDLLLKTSPICSGNILVGLQDAVRPNKAVLFLKNTQRPLMHSVDAFRPCNSLEFYNVILSNQTIHLHCSSRKYLKEHTLIDKRFKKSFYLQTSALRPSSCLFSH